MKTELNSRSEATRLEELWSGDFGAAYAERNAKAANGRAPFWKDLLTRYPAQRILEVGCNIGANLKWISDCVPPREVYGVDISEHALERLRVSLPSVNALWSQARRLPFRDDCFDLVFTAGVLIHQPETTLPLVMAEIVRCARQYVLCMEYFSHTVTEVPYRGQSGALFKRNYGGLYQELFPELEFLDKGDLSPEQGWDNVTYWLFEKNAAQAKPKKGL